jgi:4-amino-4-deoxy-L-arabinose transferase-like glycosyltransferase
MNQMLRMLAAVATGTICAVPPMLIGAILRGASPSVRDVPVFFALYGPFALLALVVIGLPVHYFLNRSGQHHPVLYSIIGVVAGSTVGAVVGAALDLTVLPGDLLACAFSGMASGLAFNLVAYCPRGRSSAPRQA